MLRTNARATLRLSFWSISYIATVSRARPLFTKTSFYRWWDSRCIINLTLSSDCLGFIMGIFMPIRRHLLVTRSADVQNRILQSWAAVVNKHYVTIKGIISKYSITEYTRKYKTVLLYFFFNFMVLWFPPCGIRVKLFGNNTTEHNKVRISCTLH